MNMPWWFRLYTLHTVKFFGKVTLVQMSLYFLLSFLGNGFEKLAGLVIIIGPILFYTNHVSNHFRTNIEFHKMSIPFGALKKAFFFDIFIKQSVFTLAFLLNLYVAIQVSGGMKLASEFMFMTPSQLLYYVPLYFLFSASAMTHTKDLKYIFFKKHRLAVVNFTLVGLVLGFCSLAVIALGEFGYSVPTLASFAFSSFAIGILFFRSKAIFHQFRPVGRIRDAFKFTTYGGAISLGFYFLAVFFGRNDVLDTSYSNAQRAQSFVFSSAFSPEIDKETFTAIEPVMDHLDYPLLYKKVDFPVASLGLEYFLDNDPSTIRLKEMLRYTKPEPAFLSALYDHFESHPEYWKEKYNSLHFKEFAYSRWPAKGLPEKYQVAKDEATKEIEQQHANRVKRRREIASRKRSQQ